MANEDKFLNGLRVSLTPNQIKDIIILQRMVDHQRTIDKYIKKEIIQISKSLAIAKKEIIQKISKFPEQSYTKITLKRKLDKIILLTKGINSKLEKDILNLSHEVFKMSITAHNQILSFDGLVKKFKIVKINPELLKTMITDVPVGGHLLKDWVSSTFSYELRDRIQKEFATGMFQGESVAALAKRVTQGFNNISKREAVTLAKTYTQNVNVAAMQTIYNKNPEIVKEVKWSSILESGNTKTGKGTCIRCAVLDGTKYKLNKHPICPLHPRCRCMLFPVTSSYKKLGLNIDQIIKKYQPTESIIKSKSYETFYKKQSKVFQSNVIGPTRASLIAQKQVKFKDLVDLETGRLRLLPELDSFH